jgi:signal peptidase II
LIYLIISAVIVGLDQWVKWEIVEQFALGETKEVIPNILSLTHIRNTGAAWSILEGKMWFFIPITIIAAAVILYMMYKYRKDGSKWLMVGLSLILAGAIGNLSTEYVLAMSWICFRRTLSTFLFSMSLILLW